MEWQGFVAGADPSGVTPLSEDQGQFGYILGKLSIVTAGAGRVTFGAGAAGSGGTAGAVGAVQLAKSLASRAQMGEAGAVIAGVGSKYAFREAASIAAEYGGNAADWVKKTSSVYRAADGTAFQTHWVENIATGARVQFKTKFVSH